ncbi:hypothetical protein ETU08_11770 [Apibacter muscae]|uniref:hypothetical protein n=1 Tax=Apibacter muscae TaxID=2509004 RepID=UPI0011AE1783|nr:hypothetical protein [Apibacter muscae]TWP27539.1 hypothetical protein ETU08_11770 [Apibacter muscae]
MFTKNDSIYNILMEQVKYGKPSYDNYYNGYLFSEKDYQIIEPYIESILLSNGYKKPDKIQFKHKIQNIFNRIIDYDNKKELFYINFLDKCNRNIVYGNNDIIFYFGIYVNKKNLFLSDFYSIPQIIDYQIEFPKIKEYENTLSAFQSDDNNDNIVKLTLWKDLPDLARQRRFNQQLLISRNKYLFNDDKSQFPWLINNDEYFMENLVTTFGYTEDKKLLKWAFEKQGFTYQSYPPDDILQKFGKFLWTKLCNGEVKIHQNSLNLIKDLSNPSVNQEDYILLVAEYINYLTLEEKITGLTFEQKARIIATLLEFGEQYKYDKAYGFNQMFLGKFIFYQDFDKLYKKEFEKNNYYNLPNLKHWYLLAEKEKDMFVNDMTLSDVPQPRDYLFRATYYTHH